MLSVAAAGMELDEDLRLLFSTAACRWQSLRQQCSTLMGSADIQAPAVQRRVRIVPWHIVQQ